MVKKYVIESLGFNDGHPYSEAQTLSEAEARDMLERYVILQPRVGHRLIAVLEERPPQSR